MIEFRKPAIQHRRLAEEIPRIKNFIAGLRVSHRPDRNKKFRAPGGKTPGTEKGLIDELM